MFNGGDVRVREAKCVKGEETKLVQKYACIDVRGVSWGARSKWKYDSTLSGHLWTPCMRVNPRASGVAAKVG